jgi:hypothetical protein
VPMKQDSTVADNQHGDREIPGDHSSGGGCFGPVGHDLVRCRGG